MSYTVRYSRAFPVPAPAAFDQVLAMDLRRLLPQRTAAIAPISEVRDQVGDWERPGQGRTIVLSDGVTMRETLQRVERPHLFQYRIERVTGLMRLLVGGAEGTWAFAGEAAGCRITWTWAVDPASPPAALAAPLFRAMWTRHAAKGFDRIGELLADGGQ